MKSVFFGCEPRDDSSRNLTLIFIMKHDIRPNIGYQKALIWLVLLCTRTKLLVQMTFARASGPTYSICAQFIKLQKYSALATFGRTRSRNSSFSSRQFEQTPRKTWLHWITYVLISHKQLKPVYSPCRQ